VLVLVLALELVLVLELVLALVLVLVLALALVLHSRWAHSDALAGANRKAWQGPEPEELAERDV
jgi:hypothetical protein